MIGNNFLLWENDDFVIKTPFNPHTSYEEGVHLIVTTKVGPETAWEDPDLTADAFRVAAKACKIIESLGLSPWFNLQANGNWGLLPGAEKFFHIHIYGRNQTETWGKPITLPEAPKTYKNDPMPEADREKLIIAFKPL
jgi:diadenosine tetraphosphate (Ap4A) HIT family hydrolase